MLGEFLLLIDSRQHIQYIYYKMFFKRSQTPPPNPSPVQKTPTFSKLMVDIQQDIPSKLPLKLTHVTPNENNLQGTNLVQEYYLWTIQNPVTVEDPTLALQLQLTTLPNQKKRFLDIQCLSTFLLNYGGTDFPTGISLCCQQLSGFSDANKGSTSVIATAIPLTVTSVINSGGIIGYNVIYKNDANPIWDITNINTLSFKLKLFGDVSYRPLPSAQPVQVTVKISRVIF